MISRKKLVKTFGVTQGFVEGLERAGKIHPQATYIAGILYKVFSAKDIDTIRNEALSSSYESCRMRGETMNQILTNWGR